MDNPVVNAYDLIIHRVVLRDQPAIVDLVHAVLSPLAQARDGAAQLLDTLEAYFDTGGVATESANGCTCRCAVTYRLHRVKLLTGTTLHFEAYQYLRVDKSRQFDGRSLAGKDGLPNS